MATKLKPKKIDWEGIERSPAFQDLIRRKIRFIVPACAFFIAYYFALPVLVGFAPKFMSTEVWGKVNLAYLFALSQFLMAWILAALYVRVANKLDLKAQKILEGRKGGKGGRP